MDVNTPDRAKEQERAIELESITVSSLMDSLRRLTLGSWIAIFSVLATIVTASFTAGRSTGVTPGQRSGMTAVTAELSNDALRDFFATAQTRVSVIVPWFIDPLSAGDGLRTVLSTPGSRVDLFFLDPDSPYLAERGRVARPDSPGYGPSETKRSLLVLSQQFAKASADAHIYFYSSIPPAFIALADNRGLIGFHLHTGVAMKNPIFFFDAEREGHLTTIGRAMENEFNQIRTIAKEVDIPSIAVDSSGSLVYRLKSSP